MNIILCGLPMSGKTTIGKLLAEKLGRKFIDSDRLIERAYAQQTGKEWTCRQICAHEGNPIFRQLENEQIATLRGITNHVIAIGGGSLDHAENFRILRTLGILFFLDASLDVLWDRVQRKGIPAYLDQSNPKKSFLETAEKRIPIFKQADHHILTTDLSEEEVVAKIKERTHG